jgi:hypothetical protein
MCEYVYVYVCVCVRAHVCTCVHICVCVSVRVSQFAQGSYLVECTSVLYSNSCGFFLWRNRFGGSILGRPP